LYQPGSAFAATFQLSCISFGVGVFAMPGVFARVGVLLGTILLAAFAILSDIGMQLMLQTATATGARTYEDVLHHVFGSVGRAVALISVALSTFTGNCAHMQFAASTFMEMQGPGGGFIQTLVGPNVKLQHVAAMMMFGIVVLPLCFKRQLSNLRFVSLGVVICCFCCCCVVFWKCLELIEEDGTHNTNELWSRPSASLIFETAPVVAFGFSSIAELFHVRAEMKKPELLSRCAHLATGIIVSLYFAIGFICALAFEKPGPNVLENFPGNHLIAICRMAILVLVVMLYPIINFPCMQAIDALIAGRDGTPSMWRWKLETVIGLALIIVVNTVVVRLDYVMGLSGSLGGGLFAYVLPAAAALDVAFRTPVHGSLPARVVQVACAVFIVVVGLVLTFGSTGWIIYGIAQGN
jgi:amino acid permease